jgi:hypothetical protein
MADKFNNEKYLKDLQINRTDLDYELATNPAILGYYGSQYAQWTEKADKMKMMRDNRASELYIELKDSGTKVTDGYISAKQQLDEQHQNYANALRLAREQAELYSNAVNALEKKQFSIQALNANIRSEFNLTNTTATSVSTQEDRAERRARVLDAQR